MTQKLIIFGAGDIAQLAHYYFQNDSDYSVVGFTVDEAYLTEREFCGLPVVAFQNVVDHYPPSAHSLFVALSYAKLNQIRKQKFEAGLALGYDLASYVSSRATILNQHSVGRNCFILEDNTIQPFSRIGDNVTLWSGNHIGHHSDIGNHTFISSHVVVSGGVRIGEQCFIGVNATLRDHVTIGARCVIGAGAIVLSDAEDNGVYVGTETERSRVPSNRLRSL
ncbi:acetyltransferase [Neorhizobium galegae]|uniref:acetyltransferase n=1 Tax=Neorhizobium galegae TaxID=399 RepID=UPI0021057DBE|nr:acetyltransferase [Neorhizobium galegae]MCQ1780572.1 acetyltransferase [Neorhizobium galegae]MCQ1799644.1 acetyltransferase [Neorhizobium galegae]